MFNKKTKEKVKHITYPVVLGLFAFMMLVMFVSCIPAVMEKLGVVFRWYNDKFTAPLDILAWFFTLTASGYVGGDRIAKIAETRRMPQGEATVGDILKMRKILILTYISSVVGLIISATLPVSIPLEAFFTALGATSVCYVAGQKGIAVAKHSGDAPTLGSYDPELCPQGGSPLESIAGRSVDADDPASVSEAVTAATKDIGMSIIGEVKDRLSGKRDEEEVAVN